jgi:hypothetical protein
MKRYTTEVLPVNKQTPSNKKKTLRKTWGRAVSIPNWTTLKMQNASLEAQYHWIIAIVKRLYLVKGEQYFERDYKHDPNEGYLSMHTFLTNSFYIHLQCGGDLVYRVEFEFYNCYYSAQITKLLQEYPMDIRSNQVSLKPDLPTNFANTIAYQSQEFVHCFKG